MLRMKDEPVVVPGRGRIAGFDGLRAIAVAATISTHLGHKWADGVTMFFVLSGFLITGLLMNSGDRSVWRFWGRRVLRLYPALVLYLIAVAAFGVLGWATVPWEALVAGGFYLTNYAPFPALARETSHLWSLAVEEQFYVLWPLVMVWGRRIALPLAIAGVCASWWWRTYPPADLNHYVDRYFLPAADAILIGCILALLVCARPGHRVVRAVAHTPVTLVVSIAAIAAPLLSDSLWIDANYLEIQRLAIALLLLWVCGNQRSWPVRLLEVQPILYLGTISYGIYLWQGLFVRNGPIDPVIVLHEWPWNVLATVAAATLSYELVERRFLRLKDRFRPRPAEPRGTERTSGGIGSTP
ncbi:hypothetical protein GCM10009795_024200 [Nocardioides hankookensis]